MSPEHIELQVKGMTCANCAISIEKYLEREGMNDVSVNFALEEVQFNMGQQKGLSHIVKGIENLGFEVVTGEQHPQEEHAALPFPLLICIAFTIPLLLHMILPLPILHYPWVQLGLAIPVYLIGMWHFGPSALRSIKSGVPNMDVLITIGATAAFGYSLYGTFTGKGPDFLFYETAASIITIVMIGNFIEHRAVKKTTTAVKELNTLQKQVATKIITEDGQEKHQKMDAQLIQVDDHLFVPDGERIPADGYVLEGEGEVNESMITGESRPVFKQQGDRLIGGTLVETGQFRMKATNTGKDAVLGKIIELVKKAQSDKPDIQLLADKISSVFVPTVLGISLLTFILSYFVFGLSLQAAIIHSVAVLVISCPCAMGLATPTAVVVGLGRASRKGILIKGARTIEKFAKIKRMVFDKTGTITTGKFKIAHIQCPEERIEEVRSILLSLEQYSNHPIARSLVIELADSPSMSLNNVKEIKGVGIEGIGTLEQKKYQLGSHKFIQHLSIPQKMDRDHSLYLLEDGDLLATIDLEDEIKPEAKPLIQFLHTQGIETILLSGDRISTTEKVAQAVGIQKVFAEKLPEEKLHIIESLSNTSATAMIGDGINDAPSLSRASVGISLGNASQTAIDSSQIVLLHDNLLLIKDMFQLGKLTVRTIKQNLFWAFIYNVLAIPLAAFGFLSPIIGAVTMGLSDIVVIGNSLWLRTKLLTKA